MRHEDFRTAPIFVTSTPLVGTKKQTLEVQVGSGETKGSSVAKRTRRPENSAQQLNVVKQDLCDTTLQVLQLQDLPSPRAPQRNVLVSDRSQVQAPWSQISPYRWVLSQKALTSGQVAVAQAPRSRLKSRATPKRSSDESQRAILGEIHLLLRRLPVQDRLRALAEQFTQAQRLALEAWMRNRQMDSACSAVSADTSGTKMSTSHNVASNESLLSDLRSEAKSDDTGVVSTDIAEMMSTASFDLVDFPSANTTDTARAASSSSKGWPGPRAKADETDGGDTRQAPANSENRRLGCAGRRGKLPSPRTLSRLVARWQRVENRRTAAERREAQLQARASSREQRVVESFRHQQAKLLQAFRRRWLKRRSITFQEILDGSS